MPNTNNDTFSVDQFNGATDSDINLNGASIGQAGSEVNIAWNEQSIVSGGNSQGNASNVVDSGLFTFGSNSANDEYTVGQSNNLFDNDHNQNVFEAAQLGGANIVFAGQDITSGGNEQGNSSNVLDGSFTGFLGGFSNNDSYAVDQFNGMQDNDSNGNGFSVTQLSPGGFTADLAFVGQSTDSGGNSQGNESNIVDGGFSALFGGLSNNDTFAVDQSNQMLDNDQNFNIGNVAQAGTANFSFLGQDISSGGNEQGNSSNALDVGASFFGGAFSNNDTFTVGQENQMADNDQNANSFDLGQLFAVNINGTTQTIDSGGNSQTNASDIIDLGGAFGFGGASNNDGYTINQGNLMIDNDINLNIGVVTQLGFGNVATIDQDITSGGNSQSNNSNVFDGGLNLFGAFSDNDTYDVTQSNLLADSDQNQNLGEVTQLVGTGNFADLTQLVDSGDNFGTNSSNLFDFGT